MSRRKIIWRDQAREQLRAIDQPTALHLHALAYFAATGEGDVNASKTSNHLNFGCALVTAGFDSMTTATPSTSRLSSIGEKFTVEHVRRGRTRAGTV